MLSIIVSREALLVCNILSAYILFFLDALPILKPIYKGPTEENKRNGRSERFDILQLW